MIATGKRAYMPIAQARDTRIGIGESPVNAPPAGCVAPVVCGGPLGCASPRAHAILRCKRISSTFAPLISTVLALESSRLKPARS